MTTIYVAKTKDDEVGSIDDIVVNMTKTKTEEESVTVGRLAHMINDCQINIDRWTDEKERLEEILDQALIVAEKVKLRKETK